MSRDVIISNVNRQHAYHAVRAADGAGRLRRFVTCIAYRGDRSIPARVTRLLSKVAPRAGARLRGRALALSRDAELVTYPGLETTEVAVRWTAVRRVVPADTATYAKCEAFDALASRHVGDAAVFHGFEQCASFSLAAAKRAGVTTILDQAIIAWPAYAERERRLHELFEVPMPARAPLFRRHVQRKLEERTRADYFLAGLAEVKRTLVAAGVRPDRVFVLPYGADLDRFRPVKRESDGTMKLMFVGHRSWVKGLPLLLRALRKLDDPRVSLDVFGRRDDAWAPLLAGQVDELVRRGVTVRFRGTVPQEELVAAYHQADAFVFPSLIGGVGLATLQAMATGLPVLVSDQDVLLEDGRDCLVADPMNVDELASAIGRLRSSPDLRRALGGAAANTARRFDWAAYGNGLVRAYDVAAAGGDADLHLPSE